MYAAEVDGNSETFPTLGLILGVDRRLAPSNEFSLESDLVGYLEDTDDALITTKAALSARLTEPFGLSLRYKVVWDDQPATAFFDPTGEGKCTKAPQHTRTSLSASISVSW